MAALLAAKAEFVYTVEIDPELVELARKNLAQAGVANVSIDLGDAAQGWPLYTPYDVIVVSGSLPVLPDALLRQLKIGGRLIAVVGEAPVMEMQLVTRTEEDAFNTVAVLETVVAPLENTAQRDKFVF
jgi:protein-L-isoaspartate(D-aspartate) O-methyltransferase